jgi:hypothetical protein
MLGRRSLAAVERALLHLSTQREQNKISEEEYQAKKTELIRKL